MGPKLDVLSFNLSLPLQLWSASFDNSPQGGIAKRDVKFSLLAVEIHLPTSSATYEGTQHASVSTRADLPHHTDMGVNRIRRDALLSSMGDNILAHDD